MSAGPGSWVPVVIVVLGLILVGYLWISVKLKKRKEYNEGKGQKEG